MDWKELESYFSFELPIWYPLTVLGVYIILRFLRNNDYEFTGNAQVDKVATSILFILLFGLELLYFLCPHEGGTFFYYMDPDVVGWIWAIVAFIMTFVIVFTQFFWYINFTFVIHEKPYMSYSNLIVTLLVIVLFAMKTFGFCEEFLDAYMTDILKVTIGLHLVVIFVQNVCDGTFVQMLLEVPLFFLGLLASLLLSVVALAFLVFLFLAKMLTASSDSTCSSSTAEPEPPASCKECSSYNISSGHCYCYGEDRHPYTPNLSCEGDAIHEAASCPYFSRR